MSVLIVLHSALNEPFREATENSVTLAEESESTFAMFMAWLYSQNLMSHKDREDSPCSVYELIDLYVFGDKLGMPVLCSLVRGTLVKCLVGENPSETVLKLIVSIAKIYYRTPDGSPLRKLVADVMIWDGNIPSLIC